MVEAALFGFHSGAHRDRPARVGLFSVLPAHHSRRMNEHQEGVGGGCGPPVAEGDADPPGPIPNPVVKRASAGGYCGFQRRGRRGRCGRTPPRTPPVRLAGSSPNPMRRGVEQRQLVGLITRRSTVRIRPPLPTYRGPRSCSVALGVCATREYGRAPARVLVGATLRGRPLSGATTPRRFAPHLIGRSQVHAATSRATTQGRPYETRWSLPLHHVNARDPASALPAPIAQSVSLNRNVSPTEGDGSSQRSRCSSAGRRRTWITRRLRAMCTPPSPARRPRRLAPSRVEQGVGQADRS